MHSFTPIHSIGFLVYDIIVGLLKATKKTQHNLDSALGFRGRLDFLLAMPNLRQRIIAVPHSLALISMNRKMEV
jgi:hypothetical protein